MIVGHELVGRKVVLAFIYMRAVVVGFNAALGIRGVDVEGIKMSTELLEWCKILVIATFVSWLFLRR